MKTLPPVGSIAARLPLVAAVVLLFDLSCRGGSEAPSELGGGARGDEEQLKASLEEYYQRLRGLADETSERGSSLEEQSEGAEDLNSIRGAFIEFLEVFDDHVAGLKQLDAPSRVADAHAESLAALEDLRGALTNALEEGAQAESLDEFLSAFESPSVLAAQQRADDACLELQRIADQNDIEVDLHCE